MTKEQQLEAEKVIPLLNQAREYLDNARFRMGDTDLNDPQIIKCNNAFDYICKALDQF